MTNTDPHNQREAHQTTDQLQQNQSLRTDSNISHRGVGGEGLKKHFTCIAREN